MKLTILIFLQLVSRYLCKLPKNPKKLLRIGGNFEVDLEIADGFEQNPDIPPPPWRGTGTRMKLTILQFLQEVSRYWCKLPRKSKKLLRI